MREPLGAEELSHLKRPMLCLSGTRTVAATQRIAALLRTALPRALHEALPGMGHMGPVTHAEQVNARIAAFLIARRGAATATGDAHACVVT